MPSLAAWRERILLRLLLLCPGPLLQANLVKQLAKLVKVRYVEDITASERVGAPPAAALSPPLQCGGNSRG